MIIEFIETEHCKYFDNDGVPYTVPYSKTFLIDTAKIPAYLETEPKAYQRMLYVGPLIQQAQRGTRRLQTPLHNSFSDMPEWYTPLIADDGAVPDCTVFVEIN